ncbi:MAG: MoxR family ATPase [Pseudomonadales bacterium]|nr:MoxR family ATPase [Pseudomonadales bacterium]
MTELSSQTAFQDLARWLETQIIGQPKLVNRLLIALLADGHLLVEGPPGLAKTKAINALARGLEADFHRVQFTPDLLPADITGSDIYRPESGEFKFEKGPIFHSLVLADEINRAPAKVQSALLEAMAERQVSIGKKTYPLPDLFMVMATQNPLEQEGTYPLPEAQLDRFLMHVSIDYPDAEAERHILSLVRHENLGHQAELPAAIQQRDIFNARQAILSMHMDATVEEYMVQLIIATRQADHYSAELANHIEFGVSPRATIALDACARAHAWLAGKDYVSPDDVQAVLADVLRHRLLLSYQAEAANISKDDVISELLERVPVL